MDHKPNHTTSHNPAPLIKQNKTKTKPNIDNRTSTDAHLFYQQNFGIPTPFISKAITTWIQDTSIELVIHAMERTLERGKTTWSYTKAILQAWKTKGIRTPDAARADTKGFRKQTQQPTQEVLPEWFQTLEQTRRHNRATGAQSTQDEAAILAQTQALIESTKGQRSPHTHAKYQCNTK